MKIDDFKPNNMIFENQAELRAFCDMPDSNNKRLEMPIIMLRELFDTMDMLQDMHSDLTDIYDTLLRATKGNCTLCSHYAGCADDPDSPCFKNKQFKTFKDVEELLTNCKYWEFDDYRFLGKRFIREDDKR